MSPDRERRILLAQAAGWDRDADRIPQTNSLMRGLARVYRRNARECRERAERLPKETTA